MKGGKLRHKITIETPAETQNSIGEPIPAWSTHTTRSASVEPLQGRELYRAKQVDSEVSIRFRLRHDSLTGAITTKMRVSWDSRLFDIESIINVNERNKEVHLMCVENG